MALVMTRERQLIGLLSAISLTIVGLSLALALQANWSWLATLTLLLGVVFLLSISAVKCYQYWREIIMSLTIYTQMLREGSTNTALILPGNDGLISQLKDEIKRLGCDPQDHRQSTLLMWSSVMDSWPIAIAIFNDKLQLIYRNPAMYRQLRLPMLVGTTAADNGFCTKNQSITHTEFDRYWQVQCTNYQENGQSHLLYTATNIRLSLYQHESVTQQNIIRVFSHELRNSLTPMASMTDTLLSAPQLDLAQTRMVLTRIRQRSSHLLEFIGQYADISQLNHSQLAWFDMAELVDEAKTVLPHDVVVIFKGEKQCFGDISQLSMVLTNLFKNSQQAKNNNLLIINISLYQQDQQQYLDICDNGEGFANLANVLTPFYTTKNNGSGIGLVLCREIIHQHGGELSVTNLSDGGAKIMMNWPYQQ